MAKRRQFGKWMPRNEKPIGKGGQSVAYVVTDITGIDTLPRVLKHLKDSRVSEVDRARFKREFDVATSLSHSNILPVLDSDLEHKPPYVVLPLCSRGPLEEFDLTGFDLSDRLKLFAAICAGVGYAHSKGVIHRDLKPDNIIIQDDGSPVVADFGLAYVDEAGHRLTFTAEVVGPRWYTAPELEAGRLEDITAASDVYSLGKLLYWLLAGRVFPRERHRDPEYDLTEQGSSIELSLVYQRILDRTITLQPQERFHDATALKMEVEAVLNLLLLRSRFYSLARIEHSSPRRGLYLISFRGSGICSWVRIELGSDLSVQGFAALDGTLAFWGIAEENGSDALVLFHGGTPDSLVREKVGVAGLVERPTHPSQRRFRNLTFDSDGRPAVSFTEGDVGRPVRNIGYRLCALMYDSDSEKYSRRLIAEDVGRSMGGEFAISNDGTLAVYHPSDAGTPANPGIGPETILLEPAGLYREPARYAQSWASPIAFDENGTLHRAIVVEIAGSPGHRELHHLSRTGDGQSSIAILASAHQLSASVAMCIRPNGHPVIISQAPDQDGAIAIFDRNDSGWQTSVRELTQVNEQLGVHRLGTNAILECAIDSDGQLHVLLRIDLPLHLSSSSNGSGVCWLQFSKSLELIRQRILPAGSYLGFGLGNGGVVHLCVHVG